MQISYVYNFGGSWTTCEGDAKRMVQPDDVCKNMEVVPFSLEGVLRA